MSGIVPRGRSLFTFPNLLLILLLCSPLLFGGQAKRDFLSDPDIWWHLRDAQTLLATHHFLRVDLYSFTVAGAPWMNPEWVAELPFYAAYRAFGSPGLFYVGLLAFQLLILGVFRLAWLRSRDFVGSYVATLGFVLLAWVNFGPRTILFGWLCFVAELLILQTASRRENRLWWLVPLFGLWINVHGSWIIGVTFFLLYCACGLVGGRWGDIVAERWTATQLRRRTLVLAASAIALFCNPYGWRLVSYPFDFAFKQKLNVSRGQEWMSLDFHSTNGRIFVLVLALIALLNLIRRRSWRLDELVFAFVAIYSGLAYVRFLFLAGIVLAPVLACELAAEKQTQEPAPNRPLLNAALMFAVLLFAFFRLPTPGALRQGIETAYPAAAFARLNTFNPKDHVLNAYAYGGYMIWNARNIPTFIDSRTDIFEHHGIYADYVQAIDITGTLAVLDKYKIRYVFFPQRDPMIYLLEHVPGWKTNFAAGGAVILERIDSPPTAAR